MKRELLDKYLAGQCTTDETRRVEAWYEEQGNDKDFLSSLSDLEKQLLEEDTLKKIKSTIGVPFENEEETPKIIPFWRNWRVQMGIAASLLLICWAGWAYLQSNSTPKEVLFAFVEPLKQDALVRFINKETKLINHRLPDGTQVCMYPNAELTYPKVFEGKTRQVTFVGEGFLM